MSVAGLVAQSILHVVPLEEDRRGRTPLGTGPGGQRTPPPANVVSRRVRRRSSPADRMRPGRTGRAEVADLSGGSGPEHHPSVVTVARRRSVQTAKLPESRWAGPPPTRRGEHDHPTQAPTGRSWRHCRSSGEGFIRESSASAARGRSHRVTRFLLPTTRRGPGPGRLFRRARGRTQSSTLVAQDSPGHHMGRADSQRCGAGSRFTFRRKVRNHRRRSASGAAWAGRRHHVNKSSWASSGPARQRTQRHGTSGPDLCRPAQVQPPVPLPAGSVQGVHEKLTASRTFARGPARGAARAARRPGGIRTRYPGRAARRPAGAGR